MKFDIDFMSYDPPNYVKLIIFIYFVFIIWNFLAFVATVRDLYLIRALIGKFDKIGVRESEDSFQDMNSKKWRGGIFKFYLFGVAGILKSKKNREEVGIYFEKKEFTENTRNFLSLKKFKFLSMFSISICLFILVEIIEINRAINLTMSFSLKAGILSFQDSFLLVGIFLLIVIFFSTINYLLLKRANSWLYLKSTGLFEPEGEVPD